MPDREENMIVWQCLVSYGCHAFVSDTGCSGENDKAIGQAFDGVIN
jgi:hypothetical protein